MKKIIEDLGGVYNPKKKFTPENQASNSGKYTVYIQFGDDAPVALARIPLGQQLRLLIKEPADNADVDPALIFTDTTTNKTMKIFAKK